MAVPLRGPPLTLRLRARQVLSGAIEVEKQADGQFLLKQTGNTAAVDKNLLSEGLGGVALQ